MITAATHVLRRDQGLIDVMTVSEWYAGLEGARGVSAARVVVP